MLKMKPFHKNMLILLFVFLCIQATIMVVLWARDLTGPQSAPVDLDSRYFRLENYTLTTGYFHFEKQTYIGPQAVCRILCDRHLPCEAYTVSDHPRGKGKRNGLCQFFLGSPLALGLRPQPEPHNGTEFFVKNIKPDVVLQEDHTAYYSLTTLCNYTEAVKACNQSFYHLAMAIPGNLALTNVKTYYKNFNLFSFNSTLGNGFFIDVFERFHGKDRDLDLSGSTTYIKIGEDPGEIYVKRIVLYNGREIFINSSSSRLGYPFCQGTPFNLLGESEYLQAKPYTPVVPESTTFSDAAHTIQSLQHDL